MSGGAMLRDFCRRAQNAVKQHGCAGILVLSLLFCGACGTARFTPGTQERSTYGAIGVPMPRTHGWLLRGNTFCLVGEDALSVPPDRDYLLFLDSYLEPVRKGLFGQECSVFGVQCSVIPSGQAA